MFGGAGYERRGGCIFTKRSVAAYLHNLREHFGSVRWYAREIDQSNMLRGEINRTRIGLFDISGSISNLGRAWFEMVRGTGAHYVLAFLPAGMYLAPIAPWLSLKTRRFAVYLANDYPEHIERSRSRRSWTWTMLFKVAHTTVLGTADVVIARGRRLARLASRYCSEVHETIPIAHVPDSEPSPEDVRRRTSGTANGRFVFTYVGKIRGGKGVDFLLEAFERLCVEFSEKNIFLHVAGDGPDLAKMKARVRTSDCEDKIKFYGWVDAPRRVERVFELADVLVMPTSTYPEGVPRVIDEAMMRGVPVVATDVGGLQDEFAPDQILLVKPGSVEALAEGMRILLTNPERRKTQIKGGLRRRERWSDFQSAADQHATIIHGDRDAE